MKKKQTLFLNGIVDRDYDRVKYQCGSLSLSASILKLWKKNINIGDEALDRANTGSKRKVNNRHGNSNQKGKVNIKKTDSSFQMKFEIS